MSDPLSAPAVHVRTGRYTRTITPRFRKPWYPIRSCRHCGHTWTAHITTKICAACHALKANKDCAFKEDAEASEGR